MTDALLHVDISAGMASRKRVHKLMDSGWITVKLLPTALPTTSTRLPTIRRLSHHQLHTKTGKSQFRLRETEATQPKILTNFRASFAEAKLGVLYG